MNQSSTADDIRWALDSLEPCFGLIAKQFRVTRQRGEFIPSPLAPNVMATVHSSSLLRIPDEESRRAEMRRFIEGLKVVDLQ